VIETKLYHKAMDVLQQYSNAETRLSREIRKMKGEQELAEILAF
jgi:hypothetical protein